MADLSEFMVHATTVERKTGNGPSGPVLASSVSLTGFVEPNVRLVRNASGVEVVSSATVYYPTGTAFIAPGSFVTPPAGLGARARVITCAVHDDGGLGLPTHVEVTVE